jgi:hypothetical protein
VAGSQRLSQTRSEKKVFFNPGAICSEAFNGSSGALSPGSRRRSRTSPRDSRSLAGWAGTERWIGSLAPRWPITPRWRLRPAIAWGHDPPLDLSHLHAAALHDRFFKPPHQPNSSPGIKTAFDFETGMLWKAGGDTSFNYRIVPFMVSWRSRGAWLRLLPTAPELTMRNKVTAMANWFEDRLGKSLPRLLRRAIHRMVGPERDLECLWLHRRRCRLGGRAECSRGPGAGLHAELVRPAWRVTRC